MPHLKVEFIRNINRKLTYKFFLSTKVQHSVQNNYIYLSGAMKLTKALKSLHDEYSEENPFVEAANSDAKDACKHFHLLDIDKEADDMEIYNFYFLPLVNRNYEI